MRLIFKILIGMILFNAFLFFFSSPDFFNLTDVEKGEHVNESELLAYQASESATFANSLLNAVITGTVIVILAAIIAIFGRSYIVFGAGLIMAIIAGLWAGAFTYVGAMFAPFPLANYLYTILFIVTGVIAFIAIAEIFTGRAMDD